jgi:hypothetical protein
VKYRLLHPLSDPGHHVSAAQGPSSNHWRQMTQVIADNCFPSKFFLHVIALKSTVINRDNKRIKAHRHSFPPAGLVPPPSPVADPFGSSTTTPQVNRRHFADSGAPLGFRRRVKLPASRATAAHFQPEVALSWTGRWSSGCGGAVLRLLRR